MVGRACGRVGGLRAFLVQQRQTGRGRAGAGLTGYMRLCGLLGVVHVRILLPLVHRHGVVLHPTHRRGGCDRRLQRRQAEIASDHRRLRASDDCTPRTDTTHSQRGRMRRSALPLSVSSPVPRLSSLGALASSQVSAAVGLSGVACARVACARRPTHRHQRTHGWTRRAHAPSSRARSARAPRSRVGRVEGGGRRRPLNGESAQEAGKSGDHRRARPTTWATQGQRNRGETGERERQIPYLWDMLYMLCNCDALKLATACATALQSGRFFGDEGSTWAMCVQRLRMPPLDQSRAVDVKSGAVEHWYRI